VEVTGNAAAENQSEVAASIRDTTSGHVTPLGRPVTQVGRRGRSDIRLDDHQVSRAHALLVRCPEGLVVRDLGSRTGVTVNGRRVKEALLGGGEKLGIGLSEFLVTVEQPGDVRVDFSDPFATVEMPTTGPREPPGVPAPPADGEESEPDDALARLVEAAGEAPPIPLPDDDAGAADAEDNGPTGPADESGPGQDEDRRESV
jgi:hypothetical protein